MSRPAEAGDARQVARTFRLTQGENASMEQQAADRGFASPSAYIRFLIREDAGKEPKRKEGKRAF